MNTLVPLRLNSLVNILEVKKVNHSIEFGPANSFKLAELTIDGVAKVTVTQSSVTVIVTDHRFENIRNLVKQHLTNLTAPKLSEWGVLSNA